MKTSKRNRRSSSRSRRRRDNGQVRKLAILGAMGAVTLAGGGFGIVHLARQEPIGDDFCYDRADAHEVAVYVDSSFTGQASRQQQRDFETALRRAYDEAPANARVSVFSTTQNIHGSLMEPVFSICRPPSTPDEQADIDAPSDTPQRLARRAREAASRYDELAAGVLQDARDENLSARNSPILASLSGISRSVYFDSSHRTLWAITDGLENSPTARFGAVAGDAPPFATFAQQARYDDVRPRSYQGADVRLLLVETATLPQPGLEHITSTELRRWYRDYFEANGAASVELTTIRFGAE